MSNIGNGDNNTNQNSQRQIVTSGRINRVAPREEDYPMHPCHICLDTAAYAVISFCGHLYCWPCIYRWMESRPPPCLCPICHSVIGRNTLIPVNGAFNDRHLVSERMQGIPERRPCPSIASQRLHAIHSRQQLNRLLIAPPHLNMLASDYYETYLPGLDRVKPLHPALLPREEDRFHIVEFTEPPYLNRFVLLVMLLLLSTFIYKMNNGELQRSK